MQQFTAKSLNRQALKAGKEEQAEKTKLEKVCSAYTFCQIAKSDMRI
jgi:hypothetical protein